MKRGEAVLPPQYALTYEESPTVDPQCLIHAHYVLQILQIHRKNSLFCDVTIHVNGKTFNAHRSLLAACSLYFRGFLTSELKQPWSEIHLDEISTTGFEVLLNYMYTGILGVNMGNIHLVLADARYLEMTNVIETCIQFIQSPSFNASNTNLHGMDHSGGIPTGGNHSGGIPTGGNHSGGIPTGGNHTGIENSLQPQNNNHPEPQPIDPDFKPSDTPPHDDVILVNHDVTNNHHNNDDVINDDVINDNTSVPLDLTKRPSVAQNTTAENRHGNTEMFNGKERPHKFKEKRNADRTSYSRKPRRTTGGQKCLWPGCGRHFRHRNIYEEHQRLHEIGVSVSQLHKCYSGARVKKTVRQQLDDLRCSDETTDDKPTSSTDTSVRRVKTSRPVSRGDSLTKTDLSSTRV